MKKIAILFILFYSFLFLLSDKLTVVTTINPYYLIVRELACEKADIYNLVPENASPHTYNPTPKDMVMLEKADIIIMNGLGLEEHIADYLKQMNKSPIIISDVFPDSIKRSEINPHIWLSAPVLISAVEMIDSALKVEDPANHKIYDSISIICKQRIEQTDSLIKAERENYGEISIVTFHNSFEYFCSRYKIEVAATFEKSPGKEPTAKQMKELADVINLKNIRILYSEPQLNKGPVEILAGEMNIDIDILDPLGAHFECKSAEEILLKNWNRIKQSQKEIE